MSEEMMHSRPRLLTVKIFTPSIFFQNDNFDHYEHPQNQSIEKLISDYIKKNKPAMSRDKIFLLTKKHKFIKIDKNSPIDNFVETHIKEFQSYIFQCTYSPLQHLERVLLSDIGEEKTDIFLDKRVSGFFFIMAAEIVQREISNEHKFFLDYGTDEWIAGIIDYPHEETYLSTMLETAFKASLNALNVTLESEVPSQIISDDPPCSFCRLNLSTSFIEIYVCTVNFGERFVSKAFFYLKQQRNFWWSRISKKMITYDKYRFKRDILEAKKSKAKKAETIPIRTGKTSIFNWRTVADMEKEVD